MSRVLLVLPTKTYRAPDFVRAAGRLGAEIVVASEERQALEDIMGTRALQIDLDDADAAVAKIVDLHDEAPLDAVVAVDDQGVVVAAEAAARLGLPHNPPDAVRASRDKAAMREAFAAAGLRQPDFRLLGPTDEPDTYPCVLKPRGTAASRGVIRADDPEAARAAAGRIRAMLGDPDTTLVAEAYVPGEEVAVEGLLRNGVLDVLAVFDKPDPLTGPYFEETIYVTPSRQPDEPIASAVSGAVRALGLREGPVHAELRLDDGQPWLLEVAARSIGGLCARTLTFGLGMSLEELILRHALGRPVGRISRESTASGVMMLPIPRSGTLAGVEGKEDALAVTHVTGLDITIPVGHEVVALPEGDRYLGFLFAKADTPDAVEHALRTAHAKLDVRIS